MKLPPLQLDVLWSALRTLLVAGGPVATLLIALGFPPVQVGTWVGIALAGVGVASVLVPGIIGALKRTDSSKIADAAALPAVAAVLIKDDATGAAETAMKSEAPALSKVVAQSSV